MNKETVKEVIAHLKGKISLLVDERKRVESLSYESREVLSKHLEGQINDIERIIKEISAVNLETNEIGDNEPIKGKWYKCLVDYKDVFVKGKWYQFDGTLWSYDIFIDGDKFVTSRNMVYKIASFRSETKYYLDLSNPKDENPNG